MQPAVKCGDPSHHPVQRHQSPPGPARRNPSAARAPSTCFSSTPLLREGGSVCTLRYAGLRPQHRAHLALEVSRSQAYPGVARWRLRTQHHGHALAPDRHWTALVERASGGAEAPAARGAASQTADTIATTTAASPTSYADDSARLQQALTRPRRRYLPAQRAARGSPPRSGAPPASSPAARRRRDAGPRRHRRSRGRAPPPVCPP